MSRLSTLINARRNVQGTAGYTAPLLTLLNADNNMSHVFPYGIRTRFNIHRVWTQLNYPDKSVLRHFEPDQADAFGTLGVI